MSRSNWYLVSGIWYTWTSWVIAKSGLELINVFISNFLFLIGTRPLALSSCSSHMVILYFYFSPACRRTNDLRNIIKDIYFIIVERLR